MIRNPILEDKIFYFNQYYIIFLVQTYWHIGKLIVENEQSVEQKAEYGKELIEKLAKKLNAEFGRGFNNSNLWYMRQFFNTFKKLHALRGELSWTHYRLPNYLNTNENIYRAMNFNKNNIVL